MTWHETIEYVRRKPEFGDLAKKAYLEENLLSNIDRFGNSHEFIETLKIISTMFPSSARILDIGAGNGIASINFALLGFQVTAVEPDNSSTVGSEAIKTLVKHYNLVNINVVQNFAENLDIEDESFDVVYIRQAMHHAHDLQKFVTEAARVLRKSGCLITIRDHVIYNEKDKEWFLEMHPLHKYYGGENAFTSQEYKRVMQNAGLNIVKEFKFYDTAINYYPLTEEGLIEIITNKNIEIRKQLKRKIFFLAFVPIFFYLYKLKNGLNIRQNYFDESKIPGRMYSYIAIKK